MQEVDLNFKYRNGYKAEDSFANFMKPLVQKEVQDASHDDLFLLSDSEGQYILARIESVCRSMIPT